MESGIQSSFIPQDAARPTQAPRQQHSSGLNDLGFLVGLVVFVASASLAGAVFLYQQYTISSANSKSVQLQRAKEAFEPALIHELTRLDDRMRSADTILSSHVAPLALFDALQQSTLTTVSFNSMSFELVDSQNIHIKMAGVAQGVNSIALQADLFSKSGVITNPIFSDIDRQADGVHFNLSALVNPAAVNYSRLVQTAGAANVIPQVQQPLSPFGTPSQQSANPPAQTNAAPAAQQQGTSSAPVVPTQSGQ